MTLHKPPRGYKDLSGFSKAEFVDSVPFKLKTARKGAKADGVRYERKVQDFLAKRYKGKYLRGPWITFMQDGRRRYCQPDGVIIDVEKGEISIVEIKLRHTSRAYWQLCRVYYPLLMSMFPSNIWKFKLIEVVKWYDCAEDFPGDHAMQNSLDRGYDYACTQIIGVHILWPIPTR